MAKARQKALDHQIGGTHYDMPIQPVEFFMANSTPFAEASVCKYVIRHINKNGIEDLRKAQHFLQLIAEHHYGETL